MITKQQRLENTLKNAIKTGNKSRAAWAIVELERLVEDVVTEEKSTIYCVINADKNIAFGYYSIEAETEKAIKINGLWIPRKGVAYEEFDGESVIRLKHWFEKTLTPNDLEKLDDSEIVIKSLQIDKTKQEKIEVPMLKRVMQDSSYIKVFFIKVSDTLTRIRKCKGLDYIITENNTWLSGSEEAKKLYNYLKGIHYQELRTKFADF